MELQQRLPPPSVDVVVVNVLWQYNQMSKIRFLLTNMLAMIHELLFPFLLHSLSPHHASDVCALYKLSLAVCA
jgi:hypothetical protein